MKKIKIFTFFTYLLFFFSICIIGITMLFTTDNLLIKFMQIISAWSPTIVFLSMFKTIYPTDNRLNYIRQQFNGKMKLKTILLAFGIPMLIFICSVGFLAVYNSTPLDMVITLTPKAVLPLLPYHLLSGPLGEELGWRSFLLTEIEKKHSTVKSGLIVGVIWGFWHFPLWLVSGYTGLQLLQYIFFFLVSIICCSIIIAILYNESRNFVIPFIVHFLNNFFINLFVFDLIDSLKIFSFFYLILTGVLMTGWKSTEKV